MPRVAYGVARHKKHKRVLKKAQGYTGGRRKLYRQAKETIIRAEAYQTRDRRNKKREIRRLWITRINAACSTRGIQYSRFIYGLGKTNVELNRKMLSELAIKSPESFDRLVEMAKGAL